MQIKTAREKCDLRGGLVNIDYFQRRDLNKRNDGSVFHTRQFNYWPIAFISSRY